MKIIITDILWEELSSTTDEPGTHCRWKIDYTVTFNENHYIKGRLYWFRKDCIIEDIKTNIAMHLGNSAFITK